ncbi:LysR family transcriptional regulator [Pseudoxanthomonas indica]|uniref:DNA-binding transcriptional regulator, LysR family n=1 Tax=Pseudoxanthomonas indica TaxID=428993 RepID=A0A1T5LVS5_9GAMM|nr:LysR family transcriptional regulator [Pseudoxanthomonas indica]GGD40587.1 transcriptional regulator [Pseudoxanthomonas indica]SKC80096.1 DNA-binding transcriptional regulator, LysR family [Pseudoxanthomonas indica]
MNAIAALPSQHQQQLPSSFSASYAGVVAFITVATEGSFARAADRLGVGRSAVSRSVQKLEAQLGARLFSRTTRSTSLTSEGELFFENFRPGVERILQALEEMRDLREGPPRGQLRIRASHGFGRKVLAPLMIEFRRQYPQVAIELMLDERSDDLAMDRVDLAFLDGRLDDSQIIAKQIIPMQLLVCASPEYAQANGLPRTLEELQTHACINRRQSNGRLQPWEFRSQGRAQTLPLPGDIVLNDDELALRAVLDGQGLAQLPAYQVCDALREGTLVSCLGQFAPDDRGHYLCYLSRRQQPKRIRVFIDFITQRVRALDLDWCLQGNSLRPVAGLLAGAVHP